MTLLFANRWLPLALLGAMALGLPLAGRAALCVTAQAPGTAQEGAAPGSPGAVIILSAPSGTGKSTLARELVNRVPGLVFGVSHTTRAPRSGEREGVDYCFVDDGTFDSMQASGRFLESVTIYGHRYGLDRTWVLRQVAAGKDVLLDLDTDGARQVRRLLPEATSIFLLPPSAQELASRLRGRGTESGEQVALRLGQAGYELARFPDYDFLVVNRTIPQAFQELEAIILAGRARQARRSRVAQQILEGFSKTGSLMSWSTSGAKSP